MGIEQIRMNQTKALPPVPQFNWSQMESNRWTCPLAANPKSYALSCRLRGAGLNGADSLLLSASFAIKTSRFPPTILGSKPDEDNCAAGNEVGRYSSVE